MYGPFQMYTPANQNPQRIDSIEAYSFFKAL